MQVTLATDASKVAWGAHVHQVDAPTHSGELQLKSSADQVSQAAAPGALSRNARGSWTEHQRQEAIHILEMEAIINALDIFKDKLMNSCVRLWCDNQVCVNNIKRNYSDKYDIREQLKRMQAMLLSLQSSVIVQYIPTHLNKAPDTLTRANLGDEWKLK